ncbi:MAG: hypothetical protein ACRCXD_10125 [Luteolibacter sp.]
MKKSDHHLIQQVLDGAVSQQTFDSFQQRMRQEPELIKEYGDYALLHHSLSEEYESIPVAGNVVPITGRKFPAKFAVIAAASVALLAGVFYLKFSAVPQSAPVTASLSFSPDAVWQIDGTFRNGAQSTNLAIGETLQLLHGQARISPGPSVSALIDGPSALTFVSSESLHLAEGCGRFYREKSGGRLEVTTPSMSTVDLGTEFGIVTSKNEPDELHVLDGKVSMRPNGRSDGQILSAGEAGRIAGADGIELFSAAEDRFPEDLGTFETICAAPFMKADWRVDYGNPSISGDRIEGVNYSVFRRLPQAEPAGDKSVLLATLETKAPSSGAFHSDGWAGLSLFSQGVEMLFFGDAFGPERTWSLDVKQRVPAILPGNRIVGSKTVTLRYDRTTGDASLHEGGLPLGPAFCAGKLPVGTTFDEIRLGASSSAALAVRSLTLRTGGDD